MNSASLIKENRERDLWLYDGSNVWFFPQDWVDSFGDGEYSGLYNRDGDGDPEPELYGYCPIHTYVNSDVETMFASTRFLERMQDITEGEAKAYHPALFAHLDAINKS